MNLRAHSFLLPPARAKLKFVTATIFYLVVLMMYVAETTTGDGGRTMWRYRDLAPGNAKRCDRYFQFLRQRPTSLLYILLIHVEYCSMENLALPFVSSSFLNISY